MEVAFIAEADKLTKIEALSGKLYIAAIVEAQNSGVDMIADAALGVVFIR